MKLERRDLFKGQHEICLLFAEWVVGGCALYIDWWLFLYCLNWLIVDRQQQLGKVAFTVEPEIGNSEALAYVVLGMADPQAQVRLFDLFVGTLHL